MSTTLAQKWKKKHLYNQMKQKRTAKTKDGLRGLDKRLRLCAVAPAAALLRVQVHPATAAQQQLLTCKEE